MVRGITNTHPELGGMLMSTRHTISTLLISAVLAAGGPSHATVIDVPADQPTIQAGIGAATNGDTVLVAPDTYSETIDFVGKPIVVGSLYLTTGDPAYVASTIIDGGGTAGPLASFTSGEDSLSVLVGFTLRHGSAFRGAGILCEYSSPRITDCAIHSNEALNDGGGIYARECGPIVENCRVEGNTAVSHSGGGFGVRLGSPRITGCAFIRNLAHEEGGAIFCEDASPVITDNVIDDNTSTVTYAGGIMSRNCTAVVARNVISNNDTNGIGGGLFY